MTQYEFAERLGVREYGFTLTKEEKLEAERSGLVVIYGASDDLCEFAGAIDDEVGSGDGAIFRFYDGKLLADIEWSTDAEYLARYDVLGLVKDRLKNAKIIKARWCKDPDYSWTFETDVPHATFEILEDGDKFCRGIVVSKSDL